jgi:hypothetical protein
MKTPIIPNPKVNGLTPEEEKRFQYLCVEHGNDMTGHAEFKRLKRKRWAKDIRNDNIVREHALELFEALEKLANAAAEITDYSDGKLARAQVKAGKLLSKITDRQLH